MTIKTDERMTTESDSKGKEAAKRLRNSGIPARIQSFSSNLLSLFYTFLHMLQLFERRLVRAVALGNKGQMLASGAIYIAKP
jgi:hypothetical protein